MSAAEVRRKSAEPPSKTSTKSMAEVSAEVAEVLRSRCALIHDFCIDENVGLLHLIR